MHVNLGVSCVLTLSSFSHSLPKPRFSMAFFSQLMQLLSAWNGTKHKEKSVQDYRLNISWQFIIVCEILMINSGLSTGFILDLLRSGGPGLFLTSLNINRIFADLWLIFTRCPITIINNIKPVKAYWSTWSRDYMMELAHPGDLLYRRGLCSTKYSWI